MKPEIASKFSRQEQWDAAALEKERWLAEQRERRSECRDKSIPELKEFYRGKSILLTGGTGFLGKALIEKLLRSCGDLEKIYVIVRPKKNQNPADRIKAILESEQLFDLLRKDRQEILKKVVAVGGDVSAKDLGLSVEDRALLQRDVSLVFHIAATVRFDEPLKSAVLLNTRGTHQIVELSKGMANLKCFIYVSTTYCNTDQPITAEKVYPTPFDWRHIIKIAETNSNSDLLAVAPKILGFQPNTYTFTKQLSEKVVDDARYEIPVIIVRPSDVEAAFAEPIPGWTDNFNGPLGIAVAVQKGIMQAFYMDSTVNLNYVSVDIAANAIIACSWLRGTNQRLSEDSSATDVVNLTGEDICDANYDDLLTGVQLLVSAVKPQSLRAPRIFLTSNWWSYYYKLLTSQLLFAIFGDLLLKLSGQKPRLLKLTRIIYNTNMAIRYFVFNKFYNSTENLWKSLSYVTDPDFHQKLQNNILDVLETQLRYVFRNLFKEEEASSNHHKILEVVHFIQQIIKYALYIWLSWNITNFLLQRFSFYRHYKLLSI